MNRRVVNSPQEVHPSTLLKPRNGTHYTDPLTVAPAASKNLHPRPQFVPTLNLIPSAFPVRGRMQGWKSAKEGGSQGRISNIYRSKFSCLDGSGCNAKFAESEIRRFLDPKMFAAYDNIRTANEICKVFPTLGSV